MKFFLLLGILKKQKINIKPYHNQKTMNRDYYYCNCVILLEIIIIVLATMSIKIFKLFLEINQHE